MLFLNAPISKKGVMLRYKMIFQCGQAAADTLSGIYKELAALDAQTQVVIRDTHNGANRIIRKGEASRIRSSLAATLYSSKDVQDFERIKRNG